MLNGGYGNIGFNRTIAILPGSVAQDLTTDTNTRDQRNATVVNGQRDAGAYELGADTVPFNNDPALAFDDFYNVFDFADLNIDAASGLLANDFDPDFPTVPLLSFTIPGYNGGLPSTNFNTNITLAGVEIQDSFGGTGNFLASGGIINIQTDGSFTFETNSAYDSLPNGHFVEQVFTYTIGNSNSEMEEGQVTITVSDPNNPPEAFNETAFLDYIHRPNTFMNVLANDFDPEGDALTLTTTGNITTNSGAIVNVAANGDVSYVSGYTGSGSDSFSYTVQDTLGVTDTATATINYDTCSFVVTTLNDVVANDNELSLREAIECANHSTDFNAITFADGLTGTITLDDALGELRIATDMSITGNGALSTAISGNDLTNIFGVFPDNQGGTKVSNDISFTVENMTLTDGFGVFPGGSIIREAVGTGLQNEITINNVEITSSEADTLIELAGDNTILNINNSTIADNNLGSGTNSMITAFGLNQVININESTISNNNSTYVVDLNSDTLNIRNSTIAQNNTFSAIRDFGTGIVSAQSTIIVNNNNASGFDVDLNGGTLTGGTNLSGTGSIFGSISPTTIQSLFFPNVSTSATPAQIDLAPLTLNGGETRTHALNGGSIAIDNGNNLDNTITDQRGATIADSDRDVGAYEVGGVIPPVVLDLDGDGVELIRVSDSPAAFDVNNTGELLQIGWVGADDGILVFDEDRNGQFSGLHEIALADYHEDAATDLEGLALAFDTNQDNVFDAKDELYEYFGIWQDKNQDGQHNADEFTYLKDMGIISISVESDRQEEIVDGNIIHGYTTYEYVDGKIYDAADVSLVIGGPLDIPADDPVVDSAAIFSDIDDMDFDNYVVTESSDYTINQDINFSDFQYTNLFGEADVEDMSGYDQVLQDIQDSTNSDDFNG